KDERKRVTNPGNSAACGGPGDGSELNFRRSNPGNTAAKYSFTGTFNRRHDSTTGRMAATLGPALTLPTKPRIHAHASSFEARFTRHSRVGSSSGSGVSCGGRSASGTWRRFTRMRVQVDDRPRMESTSTSFLARNLATSGYLPFHLSSPASAASLSGEFATTTSGIFVRGGFAADLAREGATRGASPSILRKCGGQGASP